MVVHLRDGALDILPALSATRMLLRMLRRRAAR